MKVRHSFVAGSWYAGTADALRKQIEWCFTHELGPGETPEVVEKGPRNIIGFVCPHAGYMYSGPVAAHAYHKLAADGRPDVVVIFSPNHTGFGSALALMNEGVWRTPFGDVEIDTVVANQILDEASIIDVDDGAHAREHSIELQLPFLQYLYGTAFKFVPICFLMQDLESSRDVGLAVSKVLSGKDALVIASTDMTHYESQRSAERKDKMAIDAVTKLDEECYYSLVESHNISTCGYGPTVAAITAAKKLGAAEGQLLCYRTSGDVTGDLSAVVGYASIALVK
ncbi:MAG: AmmeMemoRadiSam system protein B [Candidatus Bathyarchaeota archaeon]|nr:AmmeMemoRadiSam system protein B [Candidatus Bathyarchaeota archaeon]MDH5733309.1 AmmeMemoRadiSam system protein B [Candidatus Bathyarchaeota archaeon]